MVCNLLWDWYNIAVERFMVRLGGLVFAFRVSWLFVDGNFGGFCGFVYLCCLLVGDLLVGLMFVS